MENIGANQNQRAAARRQLNKGLFADHRIGCDKSGSAFTTPDTYAVNHLNQYTEISNSTVQPSTSNLQPLYDADGNQTLVKTATGTWQVAYNGENRPVRWQNGDTVITMTFDRMGRRVTKNDRRFVYNGYLQIADNSGNTYVWDCTENVATRPLVWNRVRASLYYDFDGNKNVSDVIASNNDVAAHYEYAPFGALTVSCGASAAANPWRFSSEYAEDDTATVYYNYRHYEPVTGRWMRRGPEVERNVLAHYMGGLFGSFSNAPIDNVDIVGMSVISTSAKRWKRVTLPDSRHRTKTKRVEACTLTVTLKMSLRFVNEKRDGVRWTKENEAQWRKEAKARAEKYFTSRGKKCGSSNKCCKMCPGGVSIDFVLEFGSGGATVEVSNDPNKRSFVKANRRGGEFDIGDVDAQDKGDGQVQVPLIHEIGHLLGLDHPGGVSNCKAAYEADKSSLMGSGMDMRDDDFTKAFCSRISAYDLEPQRVGDHAGCSNWEAR